MIRYRIEWASDVERPERLDRWLAARSAGEARAAAIDLLDRTGVPYVGIVLWPEAPRGGQALEPPMSFADLEALRNWPAGSALPASVGRPSSGPLAVASARDRLLRAVATVGAWAVAKGVMDEREAAALTAAAVLILADRARRSEG